MKNNGGVIIILIIIIVVLSGYLVCDKFVFKEEPKKEKILEKKKQSEDKVQNLKLDNTLVLAAKEKLGYYFLGCSGEVARLYKLDKINDADYDVRSFSVEYYAEKFYGLKFDFTEENYKIEITDDMKAKLNDASIALYNEKVDLDNFIKVEKQDNKYYYLDGGCGGTAVGVSTEFTSAKLVDNDLIITAKVLFSGPDEKEGYVLATDPDIKNTVKSEYNLKLENLYAEREYYLKNHLEECPEYTYTFKLSKNNNYYLYSISKK